MMENVTTYRPSPDFARRGDDFLRQGKTEEALEVCLAGVKAFPWYATGSFMLGRCYDAMGRKVEAMLEYRRALKGLPDSVTVQTLLRTAEEHEREAFEAFTESRTRDLRLRQDTMSFETYSADAAPENESTVEFLLKQLQGAKRITPVADDQQPVMQESPVNSDETNGKIVTATLAEIYANQGQYKEAVKAYRALIEQRPQEAQRFGQRLSDLEELSRTQRAPAEE